MHAHANTFKDVLLKLGTSKKKGSPVSLRLLIGNRINTQPELTLNPLAKSELFILIDYLIHKFYGHYFKDENSPQRCRQIDHGERSESPCIFWPHVTDKSGMWFQPP